VNDRYKRVNIVTKWGSFLAVTSFLAIPAVLLAQDDRMERVRQAFPAETVVEIEGILANAEAAGVPSGPLVDKALEGAAKRVPGDRVVVALSAYAARLRETRTLVGGDRGVASVVAGADALRRGVPQQMVGTLAHQHQGDIAVPLVVLADLVETGVPADQALGMVEEALAQGHPPEEMLAIPGAVEQLMRQGQSATQAGHMVGNAIGSGQFGGAMGPQGRGMSRPPQGAPVPPGSEPGDPRRRGERGQGGGN